MNESLLEKDYSRIRKYFKVVPLLLVLFGAYKYGYRRGYTAAIEAVMEMLQGASQGHASPNDGEPGTLDHSHDDIKG